MVDSIASGVPGPFDPMEIQRRFEERYRRLGTRKPECAVPDCGEVNPFALTGATPDIVCYEHRAEAQGRSRVEGHHPAGRHNSETVVDVPGNDHRLLSEIQARWPIDTVRNPNGSPLLRASASIRGWLDVMTLIVTRPVVWVPGFLEWLDRVLVEQLGGEWWVVLDWPTDDS